MKADNNELISSQNHHHQSTKSLSENLPVFVFHKEDKTKRYSLYDKWTKPDNTKKSSFEEQDQSQYNKKDFVEVNKLPWEIKNSSSLDLTKDITKGIEEVGGDKKKSAANVNTNLSGKSSLLPNNNETKSPSKISYHYV